MKSVLNLYRIATNLMRTFFELVSQNFYVHYTNHILHEKKKSRIQKKSCIYQTMLVTDFTVPWRITTSIKLEAACSYTDRYSPLHTATSNPCLQAQPEP